MENDNSVSVVNKSLLSMFFNQKFSINVEMIHHMISHNVTKVLLSKECNLRYAYKGALTA